MSKINDTVSRAETRLPSETHEFLQATSSEVVERNRDCSVRVSSYPKDVLKTADNYEKLAGLLVS